MDSYQAIYDAVRSKISGGDVSQAMESVLQNCFGMAGHRIECAMQDIVYEQTRPFVLHKPEMSIDGNQYCFLYGKSIQEGCAGFGDSPANAARDFDKNWHRPLSPKEKT